MERSVPQGRQKCPETASTKQTRTPRIRQSLLFKVIKPTFKRYSDILSMHSIFLCLTQCALRSYNHLELVMV